MCKVISNAVEKPYLTPPRERPDGALLRHNDFPLTLSHSMNKLHTKATLPVALLKMYVLAMAELHACRTLGREAGYARNDQIECDIHILGLMDSTGSLPISRFTDMIVIWKQNLDRL